MDFEPTEQQAQWRDRVAHFMETKVRPAVPRYQAEQATGERWKILKVVEELKGEVKEAGLWNLFMPPRNDSHHHVDETFKFDGPGLTNLAYALCAEEMGRIEWAAELFNCSAPDTANMEVLHRYGTREQKDQWMKPLMDGDIRSAFLMTEPFTASSDATNIETRIERDGDHYVINGRKWWSSGFGDPRCKVAIVMGKTDFTAARHAQQSMIIVPKDTPGVTPLRYLNVFGYDGAPHGQMEVELKDVRVPADNMLLGEGRGFEIAQGRLGPGRIHHSMRSIGLAEEGLHKMCKRLQEREVFGKPIYKHSVWEERVARARIDIDMTRLLCLKAADMMDKVGNKGARQEIAMIKLQAPQAALRIYDDAIQAFGGAGVADDYGLAEAFAGLRSFRLADGPDEVHARSIARLEFVKHPPEAGPSANALRGDQAAGAGPLSPSNSKAIS